MRQVLRLCWPCYAAFGAACAPILELDETYYEVCGDQFSDDFDRSDSTQLGVAWEEVSGDLAIGTNELRNVPAPTLAEHLALCHGDSGTSQQVSARFAAPDLGGGRFGVVFRGRDAENYSVLRRLTGATVELQLVEVVNGLEKPPTRLEAPGLPQVVPNEFFRLAVSAEGRDVHCELDDPNLDLVSVDVVVDEPIIEGRPGVWLDAVAPNRFLRVDDFAAFAE